MAIETLPVPSKSRPDVMHTLFFHDGKLAGCSCEHRQFQTWVPCQHMKDYLAQKQQENNAPELIRCEGCGQRKADCSRDEGNGEWLCYECRHPWERQEQAERYRLEAEKRAAYVAQFDPCGLGW